MQHQTGKVQLSACLIVKDEERNLTRCLKSLQGLVSEIVIVDTGSTDRTVEIAQSFGARVFHHPWENDFSKHRNQSIGYATGEWIFIIDADEEVVYLKEDRGTLEGVLGKVPQDIHCGAVLLKDMQKGIPVMQFNSTRLFRKGHIRYEGIVHNQPTCESQAFFCDLIQMRHYGYDMTPEQKQKKFERTHGLLLKRLEENPNDHDACFYLCQIFAQDGKLEEAIEWGERYLGAKDKIPSFNFNRSIYWTLFRIYFSRQDAEACKRILSQGVQEIPEDLDMACAVVEYGILTQSNEAKIEGGSNFVRIYNAFTGDSTQRGNRFTYSHRPEGMAFVLYHLTLAHISEGVQSLNKLIKLLDAMNPAVRSGMLADLQKDLGNLGVPIQLEVERKEAAPGKVVQMNFDKEVLAR